MSRKTGRPTYRTAAAPSQGTRSAAQALRILAGLAVAALVGGFIGVQVASPSAAESAVASLREQEAARDATQITELTTRARATATAITPVVDGLAGTAGVTGEQLAQWKQTIGAEVAWYSVTVSGMTATNIARGALRNSVEQLALALDAYTTAGALAVAARQPVLELAKRQRDIAVASWSVAATQLDQINVDAGNGHQHVYLNSTAAGGQMTGDGLPEGTGN